MIAIDRNEKVGNIYILPECIAGIKQERLKMPRKIPKGIVITSFRNLLIF